MNKVTKLQIIKPTGMEWKSFGEILYTLQRETRNIMNKTIQYCWEFHGFSSDYKIKYGQYPKDKEFLGLTLSGYVYDKLKDNTVLYSGNSSQSQQRAVKKWKSDSREVLTGERSIASFKRDNPIDLHNKSIKVKYDNGNYYVGLKLLNRTGVKKYELSDSAIETLVAVKDNTTKQILNRIVSGEYKIGGSQIVKHKHKNKWFINLNYQFDSPKDSKPNANNILGVDMGVIYPVYMAINNSLERGNIEGGEIEHFRSKVEARRNSLLKQGKYCGKGRVGHGRETRIKPVEPLSKKVSNFRDTCNDKYAKFVVKFAKDHYCGVIQLEDLSGITDGEKKSSFLGGWSYYDLQQKIKYKAELEGIEVRMINPKYTSQRCSSCGFIHKDNRKTQKDFKCLQCNFKSSADYNAAKNISMEGIDDIIVNQIKKQEEEYKNGLMMHG